MSRFHRFDVPNLPEMAFRRRGFGFRLATLEGGKGGGTPPPDPRLVEAQVRSMGIQDQAIQYLLASQRALQPLQQQQLQKSLEAADAAMALQQKQFDLQQQAYADNLAMSKAMFDEQRQNNAIQRDIALKNQAYLDNRRAVLSGVQDKIVGEANSFDENAFGRQEAQRIAADVEQQAGAAQAGTLRQMQAQGVTPDSGKTAAMLAQIGLGKAALKTQGATQAFTDARNMKYKLSDRAVAAMTGTLNPSGGNVSGGFGVNQVAAPNFGDAGLTAGMAGLNAVNGTMQSINSGYGAIGSMAGNMGQNASSMYGVQADAYARGQQADNGIWSAVGTVGGALLAAFLSDKNAKTGKKRVNDEAALQAVRKIPVSSWRYKPGQGDGGAHIGPMAQDVQAAAGDKAAPGGMAIDMISANGLNLAAIRALDKKVTQLEQRKG